YYGEGWWEREERGFWVSRKAGSWVWVSKPPLYNRSGSLNTQTQTRTAITTVSGVRDEDDESVLEKFRQGRDGYGVYGGD
ncbi:MAG TPA: hypothetical protein VIV60_07500, partial [Polyangiaceae bacterium]